MATIKAYIGEGALQMARTVHSSARVLLQRELHLAGEYEDVVVVLVDEGVSASLRERCYAKGQTVVVADSTYPVDGEPGFEIAHRGEY